MLCLRPTPTRAVAAPRVSVARPVIQARPVVAKAVEAPVAAEAEVDLEEARAVLRYVRGSPHKVRRVLDTIRGRTYEDALAILEYLPYRAKEPILKVLLSAAANAKNNLGMRKSKLYVSECFCDEGPVLKRFRPRAQGRAYRIKKKLSHITIKVAESA